MHRQAQITSWLGSSQSVVLMVNSTFYCEQQRPLVHSGGYLMPSAVIAVKDATGATVNIEKPIVPVERSG